MSPTSYPVPRAPLAHWRHPTYHCNRLGHPGLWVPPSPSLGPCPKVWGYPRDIWGSALCKRLSRPWDWRGVGPFVGRGQRACPRVPGPGWAGLGAGSRPGPVWTLTSRPESQPPQGVQVAFPKPKLPWKSADTPRPGRWQLSQPVTRPHPQASCLGHCSQATTTTTTGQQCGSPAHGPQL